MKTNNPIRAEVYNLKGEKVHISKDSSNMDLSELGEDVYLIYYFDSKGNMLGVEKYMRAHEEAEYVHLVR